MNSTRKRTSTLHPFDLKVLKVQVDSIIKQKVKGKTMYTKTEVKELLKKQRKNCMTAVLAYYAGSEEDPLPPHPILESIFNAPEPDLFIIENRWTDNKIIHFIKRYIKKFL